MLVAAWAEALEERARKERRLMEESERSFMGWWVGWLGGLRGGLGGVRSFAGKGSGASFCLWRN